MHERILRWKGRIGSLKPLGGIMLIAAVIVAFAGFVGLSAALKNPGAPQMVTLAQLVDGDIDSGRYVEVSGLAVYALGYEKSATQFYFMNDPVTGDVVLIAHPAARFVDETSRFITITGMTRRIPADLQAAIGQDAQLLAARGWRTTTQLYIEGGAFPPDSGGSALLLLASLIVAGVCGYALFSPGQVFTFHPPDTTTPPPERPRMRATGVFTKLDSVEPLDMGKRTRRFTNAIANIIPLGEREVALYIRYVLQTKTYGMTTHTTITDWGVYLHSDQDVVISSGKLLGWKDKWAVRVQHPTVRGKPGTLYLAFEDAGAQAACMDLLRVRHFTMRKRLKKASTQSSAGANCL